MSEFSLRVIRRRYTVRPLSRRICRKIDKYENPTDRIRAIVTGKLIDCLKKQNRNLFLYFIVSDTSQTSNMFRQNTVQVSER